MSGGTDAKDLDYFSPSLFLQESDLHAFFFFSLLHRDGSKSRSGRYVGSLRSLLSTNVKPVSPSSLLQHPNILLYGRNVLTPFHTHHRRVSLADNYGIAYAVVALPLTAICSPTRLLTT